MKPGWQKLANGVEIRWTQTPQEAQGDRYLLCRSPERHQKEAAIHCRFEKRIEQALESLQRRLERALHPVALKQTERQVGRILQKNQRAARLFTIEIEPDKNYPAKLKIRWGINKEEQAWMHKSEGCCILRTNVADWSEPEVWKAYVQLTEVENAFRSHKSELEMRPIWHHKEDRVQAHIFVCFLAYVLWKFLEGWQSRAGLGNSPRTILEELGSIQSADAVLPTTTVEEIRLRCIVQPEKAQKAILDRLGISLPKRMRMPDTNVV